MIDWILIETHHLSGIKGRHLYTAGLTFSRHNILWEIKSTRSQITLRSPVHVYLYSLEMKENCCS